MSVDDGMQAGSDSFWEVGKYMRTVKRCDNGYQLGNHLRKLIEERSEIEKKYAAILQEWNKKWNTFLDKDIEYGTTQGAWRGLLTEADEVAILHNRMAERLMADVNFSIKLWQKENYHKSMMHFKETKEFEENFRKAQKPWAKRLTKVLAAKKDYHTACRSEKSTANQENNARGDTTVSQDQLRKLQEKLRKCSQEVEATREKYTAAVNDINGYNAKYIEDMSEVYKKCQEFEQKRIDFFKKTLFQLHTCLDLSVEPKYSQIYTSLHSTINNVDYSKDLKWWSYNHGVDMAMNWPEFEEYSPELQSISKRGKSTINSADGGIVFTGIKHSREDSMGSYTNESSTAQNQQKQPNSTQMSSSYYGAASTGGTDSSSSYDEALNPFDDDDDDEEVRKEGDGESDKGDSSKKETIIPPEDNSKKQESFKLPGGISNRQSFILPGGISNRQSFILPGNISKRQSCILPGGFYKRQSFILCGDSSKRQSFILTGDSSKRQSFILTGDSSKRQSFILTGDSSKRQSCIMPVDSSKRDTSIMPGDNSKRDTSILPGDSSKRDTSILPGDSSKRDTSILPGDSSKRNTSILPGDSSKRDTSIMPGDSSKRDTSILPGDSSLKDSSILPEDSSKRDTSILPADSSKRDTSILPADSSKRNSFIHPVRTPRSIDKVGKNQAYPQANNANPFGEPDRFDNDDDEEEIEEPPNDGWSVRALYDYERAEDDELEFKAGDIFIQIATEDEMGWCKGKKDNRIGFYPKNYVERI